MTPPAASPAVELRDVVFRWQDGDAFVLELPELVLAAGERLFVHGPSGSGKSTLLNLIGGVVQPARGEVRLLGQPLAALGTAARDAFRAAHTGFIFQQFNLIPYLSVLDNVRLPCRFSPRRAERAGDETQEARRLLSALDIAAELWTRPANRLSVGQQQRVAAARALLGKPEIIIADEPTSALDAGRQAAFLDLLLAEARAAGSSVLFVSHDLALADHFERTLELAA
ncbi:MAG: ABC transporter ATP-binding protein [Propionivibrio sp.]